MKVVDQVIKFGVVGLSNTLLTLIIIWVMTKWAGCSAVLSNLVGYSIGLISSYIFNKQWTFKSSVGWKKSAIRFFLVFAICYTVQLLVMVSLNRYCPENPPLYDFFSPLLLVLKIDPLFYIHMFAMLFYTLLNFIINKFYTFKA
ncbi:MAG: GtrA family protein [Tannerella sp.]|jgi:putative flippase GtrA|nr:GtrA family protein [Tannerella sp.]